MTKLEIACVVMGFVFMFFSIDDKIIVKGHGFWETFFFIAVKWIVLGAMIILPLYFNFWR